jgi:hypothetical protein
LLTPATIPGLLANAIATRAKAARVRRLECSAWRAPGHIGRDGPAAEQLAAIPAGRRNHARDAIGVGVFTALRPAQAMRIGGSA